MSRPLISIGLPVFNGERFLARTLEDFASQTLGDYELIVCDNASTDATAEITRAAAANDLRIRYVRNDRNVGALENANKAFSLSEADFYVLASYDDRHHPRFLESLVQALHADTAAVLAYGQSTLMDADDRAFRFDTDARHYVDALGATHGYDAKLERPLSADAASRYASVLASNDVNAPMHGLFRRAALERIGPHKLHGSDRLIVAHAALLGPFAFVPMPLFGYRIHSASTLHLTREQWLAREAGSEDASSVFDPAITLRAYVKATRHANLSAIDRVRATTATLGYAVRPHVIRNVFFPGPDNYLGWTRWPWTQSVVADIQEAAPEIHHQPVGWEWLQGNHQALL